MAAAASASAALPLPLPLPMPGYVELLRRGWGSVSGAWRGCPECGWALARRTWEENARPASQEALLALLAALGWTLARKAAARNLLTPLAEWCRLPPKDAAKMPESAWKLAFYTISWSYSAYLLFFAGYPFFHDPPSVFYDWKKGMEVPTDIAIAYLMQGSFYAHSLYATLYMDAWRKDSVVMLVHHVITLMLITFSYVFRFWFRLYWFPLKVLYATCHTSLQTVPNIPFYFFFNALLLILTLMNIYWFLYIIFFVAKVLLGQVQEVNDVREYDIDGISKKKDGELHIPTCLKEGNHLKNGLVKDKRL